MQQRYQKSILLAEFKYFLLYMRSSYFYIFFCFAKDSIGDPLALCASVLDSLPYLTSSFDTTEKEDLGYQINKTIKQCTYNGKDCDLQRYSFVQEAFVYHLQQHSQFGIFKRIFKKCTVCVNEIQHKLHKRMSCENQRF